MRTILVVCVGNICRSPLAEHLLRAQLPDMTIWSAGLAAPVGRPPEPLALEIAAEHGLDPLLRTPIQPLSKVSGTGPDRSSLLLEHVDVSVNTTLPIERQRVKPTFA